MNSFSGDVHEPMAIKLVPWLLSGRVPTPVHFLLREFHVAIGDRGFGDPPGPLSMIVGAPLLFTPGGSILSTVET